MNEKMSFNMDVEFAASSYVSILFFFFFIIYCMTDCAKVLRLNYKQCEDRSN